MKNWKTTLVGAASLLTGIVQIIKGDIATGATAVVTGIGLFFAKDYNVTGK